MYILGALLLVNGIVEFSNFIQGSKKEKALSKENKQKEKDIIDVEASESEE